MKRFTLSIAACAALAACSGGNPFQTGTDTETPDSGIPAVLSSDLDGITYDPVGQTLTVRGVSLDNTPYDAVYTRKPGLDRGGYEAYTTQDGSLQRHSTAYVRDIGGTRAAVIVTGGQFEHYFAGTVYGRSGGFDPAPNMPENQLVSYAGNYIGMLNYSVGDGGDLLPVAPGTPADVRPVQAAEVTGRVLINADFADMRVNGTVFNRVINDNGQALDTLALVPTDISPTGSFTEGVTINLQNRGTYGGIFGGTDSAVVAGSLFVQDHIDGVTDEEEYGIFVLPKCGTPGEDALCNQPNP